MIYTRHPLSAAWPDMSPEEYASLIESIQMHGQREPITLFDDQVLDGWHRYLACVEAEMKPMFEVFDGDDPKDYVSDKHNRRSLNLTQRTTAIALMNQWAPRGAPRSENKGAPGAPLTTAGIAKQAGGSVRTANQVKAALSKGTKEVIKGMRDGTLSAKRASEIAQLPAEEQAKAMMAPKPTKVEPEDVGYAGPTAGEIDAAHAVAQVDMEELEALMLVDDKLAAAVETIKRQTLQIAVVESQRDGYMNRCNELITRVETLKRQLKKAEAANV